MTIAFISHPDCEKHDMGIAHPESPARLRAIQDHLIATGLDLALRHYSAPQASREDLYRVHDRDYIDSVFERAPEEGIVWLDPDTGMMAHTLSAALHAAGAGLLGAELVMEGESDQVFCSVRPPGHHAERHGAMGFCLFNNVAVGVAHAMEKYGVERVAIVDFDVHHGNGTEDIFRDDERVLLCSSFRHPYYPFTGSDTDSSHIVNVPLEGGSDGAVFRALVEERWLPALHEFKPQLMFISAGFDAHAADDMGGLRLLEADYHWITAEMKKLMLKYGEGRMVSMLEGGYELGPLARSVAAHLNGMLD
ncbi:MAG TPA: histone deacetylase family protein [Gammaproteobacteria bacterium]